MSAENAELPPEPTARSISPAREDYEAPSDRRTFVWPLVWCLVAAALLVILGMGGWPEYVPT